MTKVEVDDVTVAFESHGRSVVALDRISLRVPEDQRRKLQRVAETVRAVWGR